MKNKKQDFQSRLLKIQLLKQQIDELSQKYKQPVYTKKINLKQWVKPTLQNIPDLQKQKTFKHGYKTLFLSSKLKNNIIHTATVQNKSIQSQKKHIFKTNYYQIQQHKYDQDLNNQSNKINKIKRPFTPIFIRNIESSIKPQNIIASTRKIYSSKDQRPSTAKVYKIIKNQQNLKQRQNKLKFIKQINKSYAKQFVPPPKISAKSYIICELIGNQMKYVHNFNAKSTFQIASLTKIMTCVIILQIAKKYNINLQQEKYTTGNFETKINGTTANLNYGQTYTINDLLYGMMLPSGNDASLCLSVWGGRKLLQFQPYPEQINVGKHIKLISNGFKNYTKGNACLRFVKQMNNKAKQLKMQKTKYANPHGLANFDGKSTSYDIALLCQHAMQNENFRKIVNSKQYKTKILKKQSNDKTQINVESQLTLQVSKTERQTDICDKKIEEKIWQNTHQLLHNNQSYKGIKTGYTNSAGGCLASFIQNNNRYFLIILLGCSKQKLRFKQTEILRKWMLKHLGISQKRLNFFKASRYQKEQKCFSSSSSQQKQDQND